MMRIMCISLVIFSTFISEVLTSGCWCMRGLCVVETGVPGGIPRGRAGDHIPFLVRSGNQNPVAMVKGTGCTYPDYLRGKTWNDTGTTKEVKFEMNTFQVIQKHHEHYNDMVTWQCCNISSEDTSDLIVSKVEMFGGTFYRCELYRKVDGHDNLVFYKSLRVPSALEKDESNRENWRCNICKEKDRVSELPKHRLEIGKPSSLDNEPTIECGPSDCNECPATPVRALKDEERSKNYMLYLLRTLLADKNLEK